VIPEPILAAVTRDTGGGLALILGAGCSLESPTGLKLASYYAQDGYRRLVANGRVPENPDLRDNDLGAVASHCVEHAGRDALRELLPIEPFLTAESNPGTQIVMALMREDIVRMVITLNLDLSATHALTQVSSKSDVVVISRQDRHSDYGARNLVYLHGNVSEQPDHWILTNEDLDRAERSGWHQLMAVLATAASVTLFAGMGSEANVFANSVQWIAENLQSGQTTVYLASCDDGPVSDFATSLKIDEAHYIKRGWCDLMQAIGRRVCQEMIADLLQSALTVQQGPDWVHEHVECTGLQQPLLRLGLLGLGRVRALWLGEDSRYLPQRTMPCVELNRFAELLVLSAAVALNLGVEPTISSFGAIQFEQRANVLVRSGGRRSWAALESQVRREYRSALDAHLLPRKVILAHARNRPADARVPVDIVEGSGEPNDIAIGDANVEFLDFDDVLADPGLVA
jgi:hypothetical protein